MNVVMCRFLTSLFALDIRRTISNYLVYFFNQKVEAAKGFLDVLRLYMDSLCSNLQSHTITNVQSNNDKVCFLLQKISMLEAFFETTICFAICQVSLLLKESFIDSFPSRHRPFMKVRSPIFTFFFFVCINTVMKSGLC